MRQKSATIGKNSMKMQTFCGGGGARKFPNKEFIDIYIYNRSLGSTTPLILALLVCLI